MRILEGMGTEVLRPQDCLVERVRFGPVFQHQRRRNFYGNGNARVGGRKPAVRPEQKKRFENAGRSEPLLSGRSASLDDLRKSHGNNHHQVTILRRGESLDSKMSGSDHRNPRPAKKASDDLVVWGTERLGPDPGMVPKQIRIGELKSVTRSPPASSSVDRPDVYAGSAFSMSPSPRALPLPSFFSKKQASKVVDDSATRDLRRLLRLD